MTDRLKEKLSQNERRLAQNGKFDRFEGVLRTTDNVAQSQQLCNVVINHFCSSLSGSK